jgi:hypothetical protein
MAASASGFWRHALRALLAAWLAGLPGPLSGRTWAQASQEPSEPCGEVVTLRSHGSSTTSYSLAAPVESAPRDGRAALVLLPGGSGYAALDAKGCATKL